MPDEAGVGALVPDAPGSPDALPYPDPVLTAADPAPASPDHVLPSPDPIVADSARFRLATLRALAAASHPVGHPAGQLAGAASGPLIDDIRSIGAVLAAARGGAADALDVGAGLVVLCDLRAHLDRLEADLLDAAQQADLSWDLIAAIIGIPAHEAQRRYAALRDRPVYP
jgi:hypothetical protein